MSDAQAQEQPGAKEGTEERIDRKTLLMALETLRSEQNFAGGLIAGLVAMLVGAAIWAVITVISSYQIGWMAVGVGLLVALAMRVVGKGIDRSFAIAGAVLALVGCLLGNLFTVCHFVAVSAEVSFFEVLKSLTPAVTLDLMKATFSPMDLLFYGIAVWEGFKLSLRTVTQEALVAASKDAAAGRAAG